MDPMTISNIEAAEAMCTKNCTLNPSSCLFKSLYALQLKNTPIDVILAFIENIKETYSKLAKIKDKDNINIIFLVYEQP